ncbi:PspA/IM30 family protein [Paenibacillus whitsoniae]|uniref:PspA/IM30 family protein n=1 Tax=Paenibacillus whitsoniae TaxID=2496558 RepID=A0A3S0CF46_9BACL|nr:hypothetical protein [Paenibacillus whitsoniae]RTE11308.1 hypothetical protein EJQ19_03220 [Paenibacillus whitsoniae]
MTKHRGGFDFSHMFEHVGKMMDTVWQETVGKLDPNAPGNRRVDKDYLEERYQEALHDMIGLRQHIERAEEMAQLRAEQAELAMRAGDEDLARLALQEKLREEAACEQYRAQYASLQDECLRLSEQMRADVPPRDGGGTSYEASRHSWRELESTGRELGREAMQGLRIAGRLSKETLKEASGNLQHELRALRTRLQREWQEEERRRGADRDSHGGGVK